MASLEELQRALAARLTANLKAEDRERSKELLRDFDSLELQYSRETLVRKRLSQIANQLPKTRRVLGSDYDRLCRAFIDQSHFQGPQAIQLDAIHFARWLKADPSLEAWKVEIFSFEELRIRWLVSTFFIGIRRFKYDLGNFAMQDGESHRVSRSMWIAIRIGRWAMLRRY